jgi:hypothetical protein
MEERLLCPECSSDWISRKSSLEEFNPNLEILVCCRCMCHFKKDGTILEKGDRAKYDRLYKESKKRKGKQKGK